MECDIVQDGRQHKALLHSDKESSNGMQIVTYVISFYKVIHEYKVRKRTTLSTLQGASTLSRPNRPSVLPP